VNCKSDEEAEVRVQIGVLITGCQDDVEHVRSVSRKNYIFSDRDKVLNIDDVLSYGELNPCAVCRTNIKAQLGSSSSFSNINTSNPGCSHFSGPSASAESNNSNHGGCGNFPLCSPAAEKSCFLVGERHDSLKVRIVITPMSELNF
jgi:hypothetical protein